MVVICSNNVEIKSKTNIELRANTNSFRATAIPYPGQSEFQTLISGAIFSIRQVYELYQYSTG